MVKKIMGAVIGVVLIAAFFMLRQPVMLDERCSEGNFSWNGQLSGDLTGGLRVSKTDQSWTFHWSHPGAKGISFSSQAVEFLKEPWVVQGPALKISLLTKNLKVDERNVVVELIRKISRPFLNVVWLAPEKHSHKDTARRGKISLNDYQFSSLSSCTISGIQAFTQEGSDYRKPDQSLSWSYSRDWFSMGASPAANVTVTLPIQLDNMDEKPPASILSSEREAEAFAFITGSDEKKSREVIEELRTNPSPSAMKVILRLLSNEKFRSVGQSALLERLKAGIFEDEVWVHLIRNLRPNSPDLEFTKSAAMQFIPNFPGAFRTSKQELYRTYFW